MSNVPVRTSPRNDAAEIRRLRSELAAQATVIRDQARIVAERQKIFDAASSAARIGIWQCDLSDESLSWTDTVYDLFDLPRGSFVDRRTTLRCYTPESLAVLTRIRSKAIAEHGGFTLDAEIVTALGARRWIRLTATVECEAGVPVRIFGMKQDITEEKIKGDETRYLAEFDVMTGLANRSQFQTRLADLCGEAVSIDPASGEESDGALLLVDLDGFKQVNDTFGHAFGDACLQDAARRLAEACGEARLVARIGGDEFAILVDWAVGGRGIEALAAGIVAALRVPAERDGHLVMLGASVGIARAGSCTPPELFARADAALYAAKAAGRNGFRLFSPAMTTSA
jgi:diguanylate cyclase (GGDEF)-like protein